MRYTQAPPPECCVKNQDPHCSYAEEAGVTFAILVQHVSQWPSFLGVAKQTLSVTFAEMEAMLQWPSDSISIFYNKRCKPNSTIKSAWMDSKTTTPLALKWFAKKKKNSCGWIKLIQSSNVLFLFSFTIFLKSKLPLLKKQGKNNLGKANTSFLRRGL